jgi:CHAD domain-containing protein
MKTSEAPDGGTGKRMRRALRKLADGIAKCAARLDDPERAAAAVHGIRTSCKRFRALIEVSGQELPRKRCVQIGAVVSAVKDLVAAARDEAVMAGRIAEFGGVAPPAGGVQPPSAEEVGAFAGQLRSLLKPQDFDSLTRRMLLQRVSRSAGRARKALDTCLCDPSDKNLHTWRKRVKALHYQAAALGKPKAAKALAASCKNLSDLLGDHHDYSVLEGHPAASRHRREIKRRKAALRDAALAAGADIFHSSSPATNFLKSP